MNMHIGDYIHEEVFIDIEQANQRRYKWPQTLDFGQKYIIQKLSLLSYND